MSFEIAITLAVIGLTLLAFVREWASPDVLALSILCLLVVLGLVGMDEMVKVFSNPAPLTIAALFVISGALEKTGAIGQIGELLQQRVSGGMRSSILVFAVVAAFFSAWMNNTAIVAILLPVVLGFARSRDIAASKLLIPISYSSILGGCCTLIGTSTNLIVNGSLRELGLEPLGMFTIAPVGLPLAIAGIGYLVIFGPKLLPVRSSITGSLDIEVRNTPLFHVLVNSDSPLIGQRLLDSDLGSNRAIQILEVRRRGARLMTSLANIVIEKNDRFLLGLHQRGSQRRNEKELFAVNCLRQLSEINGMTSELVIPNESSLPGKTLAATEFRQRYNSVVVAVHRNGKNITNQLANLSLDRGDTLLVITPENNLSSLQESGDFVLTDVPVSEPKKADEKKRVQGPITFSWAILFGVVAIVSLSDLLSSSIDFLPQIPIHFAALVGALILLWAKILSPREAYGSVDWQVLLMIYGLLGLGIAMQNSGTAAWLGSGLVNLGRQVVGPELLPWVLLWALFLMTSILTEILSNNATAVMLVPIAARIAEEAGTSPRPFIIAITIAASCAFTLPMGYQTHMMVFGPGGYRFSDYTRIGIPLNMIVWIISCTLIPLLWAF